MTSQTDQPRTAIAPDGRADAAAPWGGAAVGLLLGLLFIQGLWFIAASSQTSDEAVHLSAGYAYLTTGDFRLNPEHPPLVKEIAALPLLLTRVELPGGPLWERADEWNLGRVFVHENRLPNDTILLLGRLPILGLSILLGLLIYRLARRRFGRRAALLALALWVLDPNVVAHSSLVTTDLGVTLFIFLSVGALWAWSESPSPRRLAFLGLWVGAAFAAKYTAVWLPPILAALGLGLLALREGVPARPWAARSTAAAGRAFGGRRLAALAAAALLVAAIAAIVLAASYGFVGLPAYAEGLDRTLTHSAQGHTAYLFGRTSETGWWYYFLAAYLLKTPPGTLLILAASGVAALLGARARRKEEMFLYVPILLVLAVTCIWRVNIGLRHILPIYPFLYAGAGRILARLPAAGSRRFAARALPLVAAAGLLWNAVEAVAIAPRHLAYFNHLAGGPDRGHLALLDSNLDWGQAAKDLERYTRVENVPVIYLAFSTNSDPWDYGVRYQYVPGSGNLPISRQRGATVPEGTPRELLAVSANVLHSVHFSDHTLYDWLLAREPLARPGHAYFVYDITGDARTHSYLAVLSLNFGVTGLARAEALRTLRIDPRNALARAVIDKLDEAAPAAGPRPAP